MNFCFAYELLLLFIILLITVMRVVIIQHVITDTN